MVRRLCPVCSQPHAPDPVVLETLGFMPINAAFRRPVGCTACGHSGFKGRIALTELLVVDDEISRLILRGADTRELAAAAEAAGMRHLLGDGIAKAAAGLTTIEEALRVSSQN